MKASPFEQRHAWFLRLCIYAAAFCVYFFDRDDFVWRLIRDSPSRRAMEHAVFLLATLMIGAGAWLCTRAEARSGGDRAHLRMRGGLLGEWLYAIGLSTLAPLWGCVILIVGESLRILRLGLAQQEESGESSPRRVFRLGRAVRMQAAKWGVFATMVVFTISLIDQVADYGIVASLALWALLNGTSLFRKDV